MGKQVHDVLLRHGNLLSLEVSAELSNAELRVFDGLHQNCNRLGVRGEIGTGLHSDAPLFLLTVNPRPGREVHKATFTSVSFEIRMIPEEPKK